MLLFRDPAFARLAAGVLMLLVAASAIGWLLTRTVRRTSRRTVENINARIRAWWVMASIFVLAIAAGTAGAVLLFACVSFLALREFVTIVPTGRGDHRVLFACFFVITPLEYALIWRGWYGLFAVAIPVFASLFVPLRAALTGDTERFLGRTATVQWGVIVCVYFVSHVPALLMLRIPGYEQQNAKLIFFLVLVTQSSDVLQYVWGKTIGRRRIAPAVSPNKTWAGFAGGTLSATLLGAANWWATPFTPAHAAALAFVATMTGFAGGLIMSAIKRDRGVKDYGSFIAGHGGMLDRIDSLSFAAPIFFHLVRYCYAT